MKAFKIVISVVLGFSAISSFFTLAQTERGAGLFGVFLGCALLLALAVLLFMNAIRSKFNSNHARKSNLSSVIEKNKDYVDTKLLSALNGEGKSSYSESLTYNGIDNSILTDTSLDILSSSVHEEVILTRLKRRYWYLHTFITLIINSPLIAVIGYQFYLFYKYEFDSNLWDINAIHDTVIAVKDFAPMIPWVKWEPWPFFIVFVFPAFYPLMTIVDYSRDLKNQLYLKGNELIYYYRGKDFKISKGEIEYESRLSKNVVLTLSINKEKECHLYLSSTTELLIDQYSFIKVLKHTLADFKNRTSYGKAYTKAIAV
ncbi:hypothetical protein [Pontibacter vulgaris]|uniref:hypothetical protein n=1 Tax=Pontibacter vulgaris TaxID=2905679 RepID=UPI001FA710C5|nr:hypothetical protein [Pontibacter vulgaris]